MQKLNLDFSAKRARLAVARARHCSRLAPRCRVDAGLSYKRRDALSPRTRRASRSARPRPGARSRRRKSRRCARRWSASALPWDDLFGALESARQRQGGARRDRARPGNGTVTISGDSKDYLAALSYVLNLSHTEGLERVQLVRHEQKNPNGPVSFAVSAAWSAK